MIIIAPAYALSLAATGQGDLPVLGWQNLVTIDTIAADSEQATYPATNLANPSTALRWQSDTTDDQCVTMLFDRERTVDYIAVARHNWGSAGITVSVEGLPFEGDPDDDADWSEVAGEQLLPDDAPALFRFAPTLLTGIRFKLQPGAVAPFAAVIYTGQLLVFEMGVQPGHTPLPFARHRTVINPRSQSGEYLGQIVLGGSLQSQASVMHLSPDWYRTVLDPFFAESAEVPFFWAWRPATYPAEVGFAWLTADPVPNPSNLAGFIDVSLQMEALIL